MADNMKTFSNKQEKMVAEALGGYVVGGSGAMPTVPGDVKTYEWLVECKTHTEPGKTIFFDAKVWNKIKDEAMGTSRKPVLVVDDGSQKEEKTWCLCKTMNLNLSGLMLTDFPVAIRKNVSAKHEKLKEGLDKCMAAGFELLYQGTVYAFDWEGDEVAVLPLTLFKEIFEK